MNYTVTKRLTMATTLFLGAAGYAQSATVVTDWNDQIIQSVRATRMAPPVFARASAVMNTAMYDAWAAYDNKANGTQLGGELRRPGRERHDANRRKAISYAAHRTLVNLFPTRKAHFDAQMARLGYDPNDNGGALDTPQGVGNVAAAAVLQFRRNDGANQYGTLNGGASYSDYTGYVPVNAPTQIVDPARWQPLAVPNGSTYSVQTFLTPHWGDVKGFALKRYDQFPVPAPAPYGSPEYRRQAIEVISYSAALNDRTKSIAEWWADGPGSETPPGTWLLFAKEVSERKHHKLDQDVRMYFALSNAMFDAGIAVWGYKRHYDYVRPVSAIRYLFKNQPVVAWAGEGLGTKSIMGQNWRPYQAANFVTPPFAEHVSGHSAFSSSAAEVLKLFTGSDKFQHYAVIAAGSSAVEPGLVPAKPVTLFWNTFTEAADEAGISRLYGGIHFRNGDREGRKLGRRIGAQAYERSLQYIAGTAGND